MSASRSETDRISLPAFAVAAVAMFSLLAVVAAQTLSGSSRFRREPTNGARTFAVAISRPEIFNVQPHCQEGADRPAAAEVERGDPARSAARRSRSSSSALVAVDLRACMPASTSWRPSCLGIVIGLMLGPIATRVERHGLPPALVGDPRRPAVHRPHPAVRRSPSPRRCPSGWRGCRRSGPICSCSLPS